MKRENLTDKQASELIVQLVKKTRAHPDIMRGASVRASLAIIELVRGYKCIRGKLTRDELKDASMLSLPTRIKVRPESGKTPKYVILEIIQEVVFGIQSLEYGDPFKKEKPPGKKEPGAEFTKELMDFQEQQYKGKTRLKNLHAEFIRKQKQGHAVDPEDLDYNLLEKKMYDLETEGMLKFDEIGDGYQLQSSAIIFLLKNILKKDFSKTVKSTKKETASEKSSVRKYMKGDTYRMMSPRHTLRRIIRKGKTIDEISVNDIRCFEKVSITGKDIAVCIDVSESMKEGLKLCYAKLAAAGVAKTAAANKDRVCLVSFSNTAETVCSLSMDLHKISQALLGIQTGKYTNAADAVKTARSLLKKGNATNQKQIIMISDGLPNISPEEELCFQTGDEEMENFGISFGAQISNQHFHSEIKTEMQTMFKNLNASNAAYKEVKKSRRKNIEVSFLYIGSDDERGITFAKKVARLGNGTFYHVKDITALPSKAFQLGCV